MTKAKVARPTTNVAAVAAAVKALGNRIKPEHAALVRACEELADSVDKDSREYCAMCKRSNANAALWREYRTAIGMLGEVGADEAVPDGQAAYNASVRPPVGNAKKPGKGDVRTADRGGSRKPRAAADAVATPRRGRGRGTST